ncbi:hypothetical protein AB3X52_11630 [Nocardioides sp. DS6]|uniref:Uncharacterized protein n=2 Tax=Nocardioides eburneus TaxID=3231482 RepID=A0ABV3SZ96_9ACTN
MPSDASAPTRRDAHRGRHLARAAGLSAASAAWWRAVHARRPDVELVLLPPEDPPRPTCGEDEAAAALEPAATVLAASMSALAVVRERAAWTPVASGVVRRTRVTVGRVGEPERWLSELAARLRYDDWRVDHRRGAHVLVTARRGGVELRATGAATGVVTVTLAGPRVAVDPVRRRELLRGGDRS